MADIEKTGSIFRVLAAVSPVTWNKISFWGRATDVVFADETTAQSKLGAITGISSDNTSVVQSQCASTYLVNYVTGEKVVVTLHAAGWGPQVTINGTNYYTYDIQVEKIILSHPVMYLAIESVPDDDTKDAWAELEMVADTINNVLHFYIEDKPTMDLPIGIKGVVPTAS